MLMILMMMMFFIMPTFGPILGYYFGLVLEPAIGFGGQFPIITLFMTVF